MRPREHEHRQPTADRSGEEVSCGSAHAAPRARSGGGRAEPQRRAPQRAACRTCKAPAEQCPQLRAGGRGQPRAVYAAVNERRRRSEGLGRRPGMQAEEGTALGEDALPAPACLSGTSFGAEHACRRRASQRRRGRCAPAPRQNASFAGRALARRRWLPRLTPSPPRSLRARSAWSFHARRCVLRALGAPDTR